ncbi:MAG: hypothetical protein IPM54_28225 [Polyangiaceae bacterium]|nr:hypothetical protein [Polyangiaceae bacterium]
MTAIIPPSPPQITPARTLRELIHNCDKDAPLLSGDPRFEDLSPGRGDRVTEMIARDIEGQRPREFVHIAFVSHRGAGKSTEIRRIESLTAGHCQAVYLEATVEMDPMRIEAEDLLLNMALAVEREMRRIGKPLPKDLLDRVEKWFADAVKTTNWATNYNAEIAAGAEGKIEIPFLGSLFAQTRALLKHESDYRAEVKQVLKKYPGTLLQSVNELLDAAHRLLGDRRILIIVDNLDRYDPSIIDNLLVVGADRIRAMRCHLILTPPISLLLQPRSAQLEECYDCYDLFTVRLRRPDQRYDEFDGPGRDLLEKTLAKRIDLGVMIPDNEIRDRLIAASGGGIRELLELVQSSARYASGEVIGEADAERAISRRKQRLRDQININGWWPTLRDIAETKQVSHDKHCLDVLFHRLAFKYNGDGWYDVHPLIAELPEFRPPA